MSLRIQQRAVMITIHGANQQDTEASVIELESSATQSISESSGSGELRTASSLHAEINRARYTVQQRLADTAVNGLLNLVLALDGQEVDQDLSPALLEVLERHGLRALTSIENALWNRSESGWEMAEVLSLLGRINTTMLYQQRLNLLIDALWSPWAAIRDGALSGLATMEDPQTIEYLRRSAEREEVPDLKRDMNELATHLQELIHAAPVFEG